LIIGWLILKGALSDKSISFYDAGNAKKYLMKQSGITTHNSPFLVQRRLTY
jgi:hypothetical protein